MRSGGLRRASRTTFNNLLTVVMGYCELLAARFAEDAAAIEDVNEIRRAGESAAALTRQLLGFSRLQIVAPRIADLNQILTDSLRMARRLIQENVQMTLRLAEDLRAVDVDPGQMEQVLLNLVINARDAMPDGGAITIATENLMLDDQIGRTNPDLPAGSYVLWSVADNGKRNATKNPEPDLRAVLHDQGTRTRNRVGPGDCLRHRATERGTHPSRQRSRTRHDVRGFTCPAAEPGECPHRHRLGARARPSARS